MHEAVLAAGDRVSGATVHVVDEIYDHGPVLAQEEVPVEPGDTPETLAARVLEVEHRLYPETPAQDRLGADRPRPPRRLRGSTPRDRGRGALRPRGVSRGRLLEPVLPVARVPPAIPASAGVPARPGCEAPRTRGRRPATW